MFDSSSEVQSILQDERLSRSYRLKYEPDYTSRRLVIIFSHTDRHVFKSQDFGCSTLRVIELLQTYYTTDTGCLGRALVALLDEEGFTEVVCIGASKGGYGAALITSALAGAYVGRLYAVLFSPQLRIWPENKRLTFPSYRKLVARAASDPKTAAFLEKYGRLRSAIGLDNVRVLFVAGERNPKDLAEFAHLPKSARKLLLPLATHMSVLPFICDTRSPEDVSKTVSRLYGAAARDADMADLIGQTQAEALLAEIGLMEPQLPLPRLVEAFIRNEPLSPAAG